MPDHLYAVALVPRTTVASFLGLFQFFSNGLMIAWLSVQPISPTNGWSFDIAIEPRVWWRDSDGQAHFTPQGDSFYSTALFFACRYQLEDAAVIELEENSVKLVK